MYVNDLHFGTEFDPCAGELLCDPAARNQRMASMEFAWTHFQRTTPGSEWAIGNGSRTTSLHGDVQTRLGSREN